ncbi:MAG TPA: hypothetical protein VG496_19240 [Myxococcales bacterium]|nr:hypothetical protein [Myxococcales bacterium]
MLSLAHIGLSSSGRASFRGVLVVLAWLALWFAVLVVALERPVAPPERRIEAV